MSRIVDWDGQNVPSGMWSLPPGRYLVESVDDALSLTPDEQDGIRQAMASMDVGQERSLEHVRARVLRSLTL